MSEPAFPRIDCIEQHDYAYSVFSTSGLTKRELFAAMSLAGMRAHYGASHPHNAVLSEIALVDADALIAELAK